MAHWSLTRCLRALRRAFTFSRSDRAKQNDAENQLHATAQAETEPLLGNRTPDVREPATGTEEHLKAKSNSVGASQLRPTQNKKAQTLSTAVDPPGEEPLEDTTAAEDYVFDGDGEEDYTSGPSWFIVAKNDGQECAALMLDYQLSKAMQETVITRRLAWELRAALEDLNQGISRLERQEVKLEYELEVAREAGNHNRIDNIRKDLDDGRKLLRDSQRLLQRKEQEAQALQHALAGQHERIAASFDEIFIKCQLLPQEDELKQKTGESDKTASTASQNERSSIAEVALNAGAPILQPNAATLDPKTTLLRRYHECKRDLAIAKEVFDDKDAVYEQELGEYAERREAGVPIESRVDFDHRHLVRAQQLTRQLIQAEEAYERAKQDAQDADFDVKDMDQRSRFGAQGSDGYKLSAEEDEVAGVSRPCIHKWLEAVPDDEAEDSGDDDVSRGDLDDWEAASVAMCDSSSMVAEGFERKHIDEWRRRCQQPA